MACHSREPDSKEGVRAKWVEGVEGVAVVEKGFMQLLVKTKAEGRRARRRARRRSSMTRHQSNRRQRKAGEMLRMPVWLWRLRHRPSLQQRQSRLRARRLAMVGGGCMSQTELSTIVACTPRKRVSALGCV
jgi:hypothetical protein